MDAGGGNQELEISDIRQVSGAAGTLGAEAQAPVASRWAKAIPEGSAWFSPGTDRFRRRSSRCFAACASYCTGQLIMTASIAKNTILLVWRDKSDQN